MAHVFNSYSVQHENKLEVLMITLSKHFILVMNRHPTLIKVLRLLRFSSAVQTKSHYFLYKSLPNGRCTSGAILVL